MLAAAVASPLSGCWGGAEREEGVGLLLLLAGATARSAAAPSLCCLDWESSTSALMSMALRERGALEEGEEEGWGATNPACSAAAAAAAAAAAEEEEEAEDEDEEEEEEEEEVPTLECPGEAAAAAGSTTVSSLSTHPPRLSYTALAGLLLLLSLGSRPLGKGRSSAATYTSRVLPPLQPSGSCLT